MEVILMVIMVVVIGISMIGSMISTIKHHKKMELMKGPEQKVVGQSFAVKAETDFTTIHPPPFGALTCTHDWEVVSDKVLEVPHEQVHVVILKCFKCGLIDKTRTVTNKPPLSPIKRDECRHSWEDEKAVNIQSPFEQLVDSGYSISDLKIKENMNLFKKTYIKTRICKNCGEINTVKASNFGDEE